MNFLKKKSVHIQNIFYKIFEVLNWKKPDLFPELEELIESIDISDANYEKTNRYYSIVDYISDSDYLIIDQIFFYKDL